MHMQKSMLRNTLIYQKYLILLSNNLILDPTFFYWINLLHLDLTINLVELRRTKIG